MSRKIVLGVSIVVNKLKNRKLVTYQGRLIVIRNMQKLEKEASIFKKEQSLPYGI